MKTAGVVEEFNVGPFDALAFVFLLFVFENVLKMKNQEGFSDVAQQRITLNSLD